MPAPQQGDARSHCNAAAPLVSRDRHRRSGARRLLLRRQRADGRGLLARELSAGRVGADTALASDILRLNTIANAAASDSALEAYIRESVRATYGLQGAVDEDHRQLAILENDCTRTVPLIDRLLNDINEDISRQTNYVGNERR